MRVVAGITTCNEEWTIGPLLEAFRRARPQGRHIEKVVVVSSACTDRTEDIVRAAAANDNRVALISEPVRRGKAAAINRFLAERPDGSDVTILSSGDVLPASGALEAIVAAFEDPVVGMAGGRPVPQNSGLGLTAVMARLMWDMHHRAALEHPKLGELVAFRSGLFAAIDETTSVDEALIEMETVARGYRLKYVPEAIVANLGPETLGEWLTQRRHIAAGHLSLARKTGYQVSTASAGKAAKLLAGAAAANPRLWMAALALVGIEVTGRLLGRFDHVTGRDHTIWKIVPSARRGLPRG